MKFCHFVILCSFFTSVDLHFHDSVSCTVSVLFVSSECFFCLQISCSLYFARNQILCPSLTAGFRSTLQKFRLVPCCSVLGSTTVNSHSSFSIFLFLVKHFFILISVWRVLICKRNSSPTLLSFRPYQSQ